MVNIINPLVLTSPLSGRVNITIELMLTKCVVLGSKLSLDPLLKINLAATKHRVTFSDEPGWHYRHRIDKCLDTLLATDHCQNG